MRIILEARVARNAAVSDRTASPPVGPLDHAELVLSPGAGWNAGTVSAYGTSSIRISPRTPQRMPLEQLLHLLPSPTSGLLASGATA